MHKTGLIALFTSIILITGCAEEAPQAMLERYAQRVANSLEQNYTLDLSRPPDIAPLPRRRDRLLATEDIRQGMLEVLNLRHCGLLPLIAKRNSSLGRVMTPSQQLIYELKLYNRLRECRRALPQMELEAETVEQINTLWEAKRRNLPLVIWNSIYNSEEMERNFSLSEPALPLSGEDGFSATMAALQHFNILASLASNPLDWQLPAFIEQLEQDYLTLYSNRFGSRWQRSIYQLTLTLEHTASVIETRLQRRPLCFHRQANRQAAIVNNVFHKYYAGEVQPYMARLDHRGHRWLARQDEILNKFNILIPDAMQNYRHQVLSLDNPLAPWKRYLRARNHHTEAWQRLLTQCGLMPGS